jgi:hypothetical protein
MKQLRFSRNMMSFALPDIECSAVLSQWTFGKVMEAIKGGVLL